ncbi:flagellar motor protein MotB [Sphingomonas sp.]|uniref:flagellar motor protein MotB n=1 Tax=Sphingomonas sp. TaxID=28214 RepID=UPI001B222E5E|nr:flagellar motor protein MotB [Sphingomonas sp.]MBO9713913.1 flagellar motor protein MotB [Sphingomonas sp.]
MSWDEEAQPRRPWLVTLADLSLLLVGFFVLLQSVQRTDPQALAAGIRAGFGVRDAESKRPAPAAMPVDLATVSDFAAGSALPPDTSAAIAWARLAARDPRTRLRITGESDGTPADVDLATGSAAILAADRARTVAALLVRAGAVPADRIAIATSTGRRRVLLTLGYEGPK